MIMEVKRISQEAARQKVSSGEALLVCAYDDAEKCNQMHLEGAISLDDLNSRSVDKSQEIIFYCA
jgi:hypothetical protein